LILQLAGVYNTFQCLLPIEAARKSYFTQMLKEMKPGLGSISIFVGLNASHAELGITKKQNIWSDHFLTNHWLLLVV
jgi:hypothetical protein